MSEKDKELYAEFVDGLTDYEDDYASYVELSRHCDELRVAIAENQSSLYNFSMCFCK